MSIANNCFSLPLMINGFLRSVFQPTTRAKPLVRFTVWLVALCIAGALVLIRVSTAAEFAFASAVVLPVFAVAWFVSKKDGVAYSALAAFVWVSADVNIGWQFSATWVLWINWLTLFGIYTLVVHLTSSLREVLIREYETARHDALTRLLNRRAFYESGDAEAERAKRYGHPLGIIFLDLDNFKQLNDTRGHKVGDLALKAVARALFQTLRNSDMIARIGGDEFVVVLPETNFESTTEAGRKLENTINNALEDFSPVSVSIGIAWFEKVTDSFSRMVSVADGLMYEVKEAGKHGVRSKKFTAITVELSSNDAA